MEYTVGFDDDGDICTVQVTGTLRRPEDSLTLQQLARDVGVKQNYLRFLFDMTQAEIIGDTSGAYEAGTVPVDTDRQQVRQRIALVYSGDLTNHKFLETVAVNRGYQLRVFDNLDMALEWLKKE